MSNSNVRWTDEEETNLKREGQNAREEIVAEVNSTPTGVYEDVEFTTDNRDLTLVEYTGNDGNRYTVYWRVGGDSKYYVWSEEEGQVARVNMPGVVNFFNNEVF